MENMRFQTEVRELLHMMIHSVYSNKEIFLRELIANAADAIDKARFLALTNPELAQEWEIRITPDAEAGTLSISDNGIGMSKEEVVQNLGTIAHSGTKAFLENLAKTKKEGEGSANPELIGQFGVGFYASFMVADKVVVDTLKAGTNEAVRWESNGEEEFTLGESDRKTQGTTVTLYLKNDEKQFLEQWRISTIVKKYSDFIEHPIKMLETGKDKDGKETTEDKTLNSQKAIWLRPESEVKPEEYDAFYQHLSGDYGKPLARINYSAEGTSEFKALLFLPEKKPWGFEMPGSKARNLHLYIRRVFISDDCKGLIPEYLRFVSGVVDSSDLPLNISREMLQDNPQISRISKALTKRVLSELTKMLENEREKYVGFYQEFGRQIKEGAHGDYANKEKLQSLLMYETMNGKPGELHTLKEYVTNMPAEQKDIYYITGEARAYLENSPHIESFRKAGYDVLFMSDPIDEWVLEAMPEFDGKKLVSVSKAKLDNDSKIAKELEENAKKASEEKGGKDLLGKLKDLLKDKVKDVKFSGALTESASRLSGDDYDPSPYMQRIMKALDKNAQTFKRILELNPSHPLIAAMTKLVEKTPDNPKLGEFADMLYDQALLAEGSPIADPALFAKRAADLMTLGVEKEI